MRDSDVGSNSALAGLLTPQNLVSDFGSKSSLARDAVGTLFDALGAAEAGALACWMPMFGRWAGRAIDKLPQHLARLAGRYRVVAADADFARLLLALQTYYALSVNLLAERFAHCRVDGSLPGNPFAWPDRARSKVVDRIVKRMTDLCAGYRLAHISHNLGKTSNSVSGGEDIPVCRQHHNFPGRQECLPHRDEKCGLAAPSPADDGDCDLFKLLYQDLFPRPLRRQLGEYYTPDWLAAHVLDQVGYTGQSGQRLLDPACGSGTFLLMALRRAIEEGGGRRAEGGRRKGNERRATTSPPSALRPPPTAFRPPLVGFDLNLLAVMTARANYLITLAQLLPGHPRTEAPIYLYDSILGRGEAPAADCKPFDFVVGNPPWIAWDNLPDEDRQATMPLWERYGLFTLSGNEARHGGGKKDLSMLMLYAAADRYLKPGGRLGMVITQTLFQTKGAGDGFRRFQLGADGPMLKVLRVDDMVALRPFGDAANWTSTIVLEKGAATTYPVPYFRWGERKENDECGMMNDEGAADNATGCKRQPLHHSSFIIHHLCLARPIDPTKPTSPWLVQEIENIRWPTVSGQSAVGSRQSAVGSVPPSPFPLPPSANPQSPIPNPSVPAAHAALPADYVAHLGANSGGANGVYWLEVLGESDGGVLVRNLATRGKHRLDVVEQVIEPDLLYPLLRWGDIARYSAVPRAHLLLAQDPATRAGIDETIMRSKYPRTFAYLERFREVLASRAAYRRYQQSGPFYAMYNVGPYTVAPIKVVWRRMDRQINATVVEPRGTGDTPTLGVSLLGTSSAGHELPQRHCLFQAVAHLGEKAELLRPMIPQETCVLVACDSSDEAHYLCAMLNRRR